jgi:hypothetical protein
MTRLDAAVEGEPEGAGSGTVWHRLEGSGMESASRRAAVAPSARSAGPSVPRQQGVRGGRKVMLDMASRRSGVPIAPADLRGPLFLLLDAAAAVAAAAADRAELPAVSGPGLRATAVADPAPPAAAARAASAAASSAASRQRTTKSNGDTFGAALPPAAEELGLSGNETPLRLLESRGYRGGREGRAAAEPTSMPACSSLLRESLGDSMGVSGDVRSRMDTTAAPVAPVTVVVVVVVAAAAAAGSRSVAGRFPVAPMPVLVGSLALTAPVRLASCSCRSSRAGEA